MNKKAHMKTIEHTLLNLTSSPLYKERIENNAHPVIGEGSLNASIMFIGEAPGKHEAESGRPFVGRAGKILDELLASVGISRTDVYITNIVKDRPPQNRDPLPEEIELYAPFLDTQIEIIQPFVLATLGRFSMNYILHRYGTPDMVRPISENHGKVFRLNMPWGTTRAFPLYHPAATIYNRTIRKDLQKDFHALVRLSSTPNDSSI